MPKLINKALGGAAATVLNNGDLDTLVYKFGQAAVAFDGQFNSYIKSGTPFSLGTQVWCFEMWVNMSSVQPNTVVRLAQCSTDLPNEFGPGHVSLRASGGLALVVYDYDQGTPLISTAENLVGAGWKHVAVSRAGSTWRLFVDGVVVGTGEWAGSIVGSNEWLIGGNSYSPTGFSGWADDIRFTFGAARYTSAFTPPSTAHPDFSSAVGLGDPYFGNVKLLVNAEQTPVKDLSTSVKTITFNGSASVSQTEAKYGLSSLYFPGNDQSYALVNEFTGLDFGAADFTIEFWMYPTVESSGGGIFTETYAGGITPISWAIHTGTAAGASNGTTLAFGVYDGGWSGITSTHTPVANQWTHVAVVRASGVVTIYANGQPVGSGSFAASIAAGTGLEIGHRWDSSSAVRFAGYLDDIRITNAVARYTAAFTPSSKTFELTFSEPYYTNTSLLLPMNGGNESAEITDNSLSQKLVTVNGSVVLSNVQSKFGGVSAYFPGTNNSYLSIADSDDFWYDNQDFTVEFWVYFNSVTSCTLIGHELDNSGATLGLLIDVSNGTLRHLTYILNSSYGITSPPVFTAGQWYHVAVVRNGTNFTSYVDGVLNAQVTNLGTASINNSPAQLRIGANYSGADRLNGYIDDLRITKGVARYTSNFSVPTTSVAASGSPSARYWRIKDITVPGGQFLEISALALYTATAQQTITAASSSVAPAIGSVSSLIDASFTTYCNWAEATAENSTFWIALDLGSAKQITGIAQGGYSSSNRAMTAFTLEYSSDNVNWLTLKKLTGLLAPVSGAMSAVYSVAPSTTVSSDDAYANYVELLLGFDGSDGSTVVTDLSSVPKTLTTSGSFALTTIEKKFGSASLANVDTGVGGVTITPTASLQMGNSNFTFECWVYKIDSSHCRVWNFNVFTGVTNDEISLGIGATFISFAVGSFNSAFTYTLPLNSWHHFALVRNGTSILLFLNGVQLDFTGIYSGTLPTQDRMIIGNMSRNGSSLLPFIGFIDEFRITKGIARYTSNFDVSPFSVATSLTQSGDEFFNQVKLLYNADTYTQNVRAQPEIYTQSSLSQFTPPPFEFLSIQQELYVLRSDYAANGGNGRIYGTVQIKGTPNVPVRRLVRLFRDRDGVMLDEGWSDAVTGAYEFIGYDPTLRYTVLAYDYEQNFRAVVADNLTPEPYL